MNRVIDRFLSELFGPRCEGGSDQALRRMTRRLSPFRSGPPSRTAPKWLRRARTPQEIRNAHAPSDLDLLGHLAVLIVIITLALAAFALGLKGLAESAVVDVMYQPTPTAVATAPPHYTGPTRWNSDH